MYLSWESIQANAISFAKRWEDATSEEAQAQSFTIDFLRVFGVDDPEKIGNFEYKVPLDDGHVGYIDYFWKKKIAIEMRACLETHLSIMKRFNSMLAMAI